MPSVIGKTTYHIMEKLFETSKEIQETVEFGKHTSYSFTADSFSKEAGEWIVNNTNT